jgi:hypothetical protein
MRIQVDFADVIEREGDELVLFVNINDRLFALRLTFNQQSLLTFMSACQEQKGKLEVPGNDTRSLKNAVPEWF